MNRWILLFLVSLIAATPAVTAQEAVPFEFELPPKPVEVDLFNCRLDVVVEKSAVPLLRGFAAEGATGPPPTFEVGTRSGMVRIRRSPVADEIQPPRAIIELVLDPSQNLIVKGEDLSISVEGPGQPETVKPGPRLPDSEVVRPRAAGHHTFEISNSEVNVFGVQVFSVVAANTALDIERSWGAVTTELHWSDLSVRDHEGSATVNSVDSQSTFENFTGGVSFTIEGGALQLTQGKGEVTGSSKGGLVATDYWEGAMGLTGESATFEIRGGKTNLIKVNGSNSDVTLDGIAGPVNTDLVGGMAAATSGRGNLTLNAKAGADVTVEEHEGSLSLTLIEDATAELTEVAGNVVTEVTESELAVRGCKSLDLTATNARITAEAINRLAQFNVVLSDVELDLRNATDRKLDLRVMDESYVTVYLDSPCKIQVRESTEGGRGLSVSGCEVRSQNSGRWKGKHRKGIDGRSPFIVNVQVSERADLRIQGSP